ncbi:hypothetical protein GGX14DRAFT_561790 [Mycena pura]|uniref:Uncharacterized protein n=1 Tax=Mycena pura TaxID=153505 RepID=A0AAD6VNF0_9AGAR|nr:hypothetical protein GGX14DRAFT_561790 [Mycena pura]
MQLAFDPSCARHCTPRQTTPSLPAPPLCTPAPLLCTPAPPSARRSRQLDAAPPATSQPHRLRAACALYILRALCTQPVPSAHCLRPLHFAPRRLHAAPAVCIPLPPIVRRPPPFARRPRHLHAARALCTSPHPLHAAPAPCTPPSPSACYPPPFARRRCPSSPTHAPLSVCGLVLDARRRCRPATPRAAPRGFDALLPLRGLVLTARSRRRTWERVRLVFDTLRHCHPAPPRARSWERSFSTSRAAAVLAHAHGSVRSPVFDTPRRRLILSRAPPYERARARVRHPAPTPPCTAPRTLTGAYAGWLSTLRAAAAALHCPLLPCISPHTLQECARACLRRPAPPPPYPPRARSGDVRGVGYDAVRRRRLAPPHAGCAPPPPSAHNPAHAHGSLRGLVLDAQRRRAPAMHLLVTSL